MAINPFMDPFRTGLVSTTDIFRRARGGPVRRAKPAEGALAEAEPEAASPEEDVAPDQEKVVLKNPKWEAEEVGFNEETPISVEALLPESHAHKTKVAFELFAKTPEGPERIGAAEGVIENDKATCRMPIYMPQYRDEAGELLTEVEYWFTAKHSASDLLEDDTVIKKVDRMADLMIESHVINGVTFTTGKSFVRASQKEALKALCESIAGWRDGHPEGKLAVFGHTDAVGQDDANKQLSARRARAVHAYLVRDPTAWESLYNEEKWGLTSTQELLKHLGHDPGPLDGQDGPKTKAAVKAFQGKNGLGATGAADAGTRKALYKAFMDRGNALELAEKDFDSIAGKPHVGCSEFNLLEKTEADSEKNRRVAVFLLKSDKSFPVQYPCKHGDPSPCRKQAARKGERRSQGFSCLFYDKLVEEAAAPPPPPPPPPEDGILEVAWEKPSVIAWDEDDKPEMRTKVKVKTQNLPPAEDGVLEIFQYAADGSHVAYQKIEGLKLDADVLTGPDGKELEVKVLWHDAIYGYGKTQYFCKLTTGGKEKESAQTREALLQLKHYNGIIANPSGDLAGAGVEGVWVATRMREKGPWLEATVQELVEDGHPTRLFNAVGNATMKKLLERNKFIHHQSSHGTAYCWCDGNRNFFVDTGVAGADGSNDWACPVCNKSSDGVGVIMNKDFSNLFFRSAVKKLERAPKVLIFANCCLTATTGAYARAWLAKGVRWYIGWAIPVDDGPAVDFAKAFYRRWFGHYKMDPDKVKHAWNDVKGPYMAYRPRIFGK